MFCKISPPAGAKMNNECFHLPLTTQFNCECENFQHNTNVLMTGPTEFIHEQLAHNFIQNGLQSATKLK